MQRLLILTLLSIALFLTGCTSCTKEKETKQTITPPPVVEKKSVTKVEKSPTLPTSPKSVSPKETNEPTLVLPEGNDPIPENLPDNVVELEIEAFKTIQPKIMKETEKLPACLEQAETKEEAFACSKALRELHKEMSIAMGDFSDPTPENYADDFAWDEKTKSNMIQEIENGTEEMIETQACIEGATTNEELEQCLAPKESDKDLKLP